jgi:hypothetical protein
MYFHRRTSEFPIFFVHKKYLLKYKIIYNNNSSLLGLMTYISSHETKKKGQKRLPNRYKKKADAYIHNIII